MSNIARFRHFRRFPGEAEAANPCHDWPCGERRRLVADAGKRLRQSPTGPYSRSPRCLGAPRLAAGGRVVSVAGCGKARGVLY